jgi:hypothetical protein
MASLLEFNARAALCRRLAKLEPASSQVWLAEAERWSHLAQVLQQAQMAGVPPDGSEAPHEVPDTTADQLKAAASSDASPEDPGLPSHGSQTR